MKEDFLHYVWKHQLFSVKKLITEDRQVLQVLTSGYHNQNAGPDFFNSKLVLDNITWAGNVEIHVKSSDWYLHQHEKDENYQSIILHVVWEDDVSVFNAVNQQIPTLVLKGIVPNKILENYYRLSLKDTQWIPCQNTIKHVDGFVMSNWKTRLYLEKLEDKSILINELLLRTNNDYEAVLFSLLMKNFGLKTNGDVFLKLASSIDFSIIRKVRHNSLKLNALLFGQAGFLKENIEDSYYQELKNEYGFLKHKHQLESLNCNDFQFFKMRPSNFPTVRIAQIVQLYHLNVSLFSKLMQITNIEDFYTLFSVELIGFWETHYTFQKVSPNRAKRISKSFVDLLLINSIFPLKFHYYKEINKEFDEEFWQVLHKIKPEKNSVISKFDSIGVESKSAFDTQALLLLKKKYCANKRCLHCAIGNDLMKRT